MFIMQLTEPDWILGGYRRFRPPVDLRFFLEGFWVHETPIDFTRGDKCHLVLPDYCTSIAFIRTRLRDGSYSEGSLVLVGPVRKPRYYGYHPGLEMTAVSFKTEYCIPVLGISPKEHWDAFEAPHEMKRLEFEKLKEVLETTKSPEEVFGHLIDWSRDRIAVFHKKEIREPQSTTNLLNALRAFPGESRIAELCQSLGQSPRHLRRRIKGDLGFSPKTFLRILRLNALMQMADAMTSPKWAYLACAAGYFDQAHLIRDCKEITGLTPTVLHRDRRAEWLYQSHEN